MKRTKYRLGCLVSALFLSAKHKAHTQTFMFTKSHEWLSIVTAATPTFLAQSHIRSLHDCFWFGPSQKWGKAVPSEASSRLAAFGRGLLSRRPWTKGHGMVIGNALQQHAAAWGSAFYSITILYYYVGQMLAAGGWTQLWWNTTIDLKVSRPYA